jgi:hypothetical protein
MDCAACYKNPMTKIVDSEVKNASYGDVIYTKLVRKFRKKSKLVPSKAHTDSAFGYHAEGIIADCYDEEILKNNLGFPPKILEIPCSSQESKTLGEGYYYSLNLLIHL